MPGRSASSQVDRFSNDFNPAIGAVLDVVADYLETDGATTGENGLDLRLRAAELNVSSWLDPSAWAYGVVVFAEDEVVLEEGALQYVGFDNNVTLRGGRFFVDFGKQMQAHVHDLRTLDRPAVLSSYLGAELAGDGFEFDNWFTAGDATAVRYSLGVFGSLLSAGHDHGGAGATAEAEPFDNERKQLDELALTGRITGFADAGTNGTVQLGASARYIPDFGFEAPGSTDPGGTVSGLSNGVFGLDLSYGWQDDTATKSWTTGGEFLVNTGDINGEVDDNVLIGDPSDDLVDVVSDTVWGFYAFVDHGWNLRNNAGVQFNHLQLPENGRPETSVLELYYTRHISEFQRLRFVLEGASSELDPDAVRFAVQWTGFLGVHAHGLNW